MSSIKRWTSCLASARLCEQAPLGFDEPWTIDGKVAHALLEKMLNEREDDASKYVGVAVSYETEDNVLVAAVVKPETARAVQIALDAVYEILELDPHNEIWIERKVEIPSMSIPGRLWGTADIIVYLPKFKRLYVIDYKHGAGIFVDVKDNMQVKGYALAALLALIDGPIEEVQIGIVQPRSFTTDGSIRWDVVTPVGLLDYHAWLDERALLTLDDDAPFKPDAEYCRWCPAASICVAYEQFALSATGAKSLAEIVTKPLPDPKKLPLERIALIKLAEPFIRGWLKAANSVAMGAAYRGYDVPGFKLVQGRAERAWYGQHHEIAETLALISGLPIERFFAPTLITLTEAEQLVVDSFRNQVVRQEGETKKAMNVRANKASEMARELMAQLTLKEPGARVTLALAADPRPRVDAAASNFAGLINVDPQEL